MISSCISQMDFIHKSFHKFFTNNSQIIHKCISQIAMIMGSDGSDFVFHRGFFFFLCVTLGFWTALFESTYGRLLLEQYFSFRDLVIRPWSLLQAPSQLNDNSLLKTFFQRSIYGCIRLLYLYMIFMMQIFVYVICTLFTAKKKLSKETKK